MTWLSDRSINRLREAADVPDLSGTRYTLLNAIGRGGMGSVWLVQDAALNRRVALKVLHFDEVSAEARTLARLEHPGIVPIHDTGTLPDGRGYFTMKYVEGTRLDRFAAANPPLVETLRVFSRICEAVAFAHAHGVIHRDLKPANVMLGAFGEVMVMDWGLAAAAGSVGSGAAGTADFMAPEQAIGAPAGAPADIYSLGVMMRCLIANPPKRLASIIVKATSPAERDRYASALDLAADLAGFLDSQPVSAYRENLWERALRVASRHRVALILVAAYLIVRIFLLLLQRNSAVR